MNTHTHTHPHPHTHIPVHTHTHTHIPVHTHIHSCTQLYSNAHTHTHILRGLNVNKVTGQDRIPPKLVKPAAGPLSHHLANIFSQCVDTGELPDDAKLAEVVPLYKKDDNLNMKNYRPVSILPSMSEVLGKIILHQMRSFLRDRLENSRLQTRV